MDHPFLMRLMPAVLVIALAGCSNDEPIAPQATAGGGEASRSTGSAIEGVDAKPSSTAFPIEGREMRLVRLGAAELALQFEFHNGTKQPVKPDDLGIDEVARAVHLVDPARGTAYGIVDSGSISGRMSENNDDAVAPGQSVTLTAVFTAPPEEAASMLVLVDGLLPVQVPIQAAGSKDLVDDPVLHGASATNRYVAALTCRTVGGEGAGQPQVVEYRVPADLLFEFAKATLTKDAEAALDALVKQLTRGGALTVEGHTDSIGDDASNQRLSEARAGAIKEALAAKLGSRFTVQTAGFGETKPIAPNTKPDGSDSPDGRAQNRRVEIRQGTVSPGAPPKLTPRELKRDLAAAGYTAKADSARRHGGYLVATVAVTNPTSSALPLKEEAGIWPINGSLTVADQTSQRRTEVCAAPGVNIYQPIMWTFGDRFVPGRRGEVPAGATVTFWGIYRAPATEVGAVDFEIGGFGTTTTVQLASP